LSRRAFHIKHVLGVITIIALIIVLGILLVQTAVQAQTADIQSYIGDWCGSDSAGNNYMHLDIEYESGRAIVRFNWRNENQSECSIEHADAVSAEFLCAHGDLDLVTKRDDYNLKVDWTLRDEGVPHEQILSDCRP
jgi:low affinity Fe/Cu permease